MIIKPRLLLLIVRLSMIFCELEKKSNCERKGEIIGNRIKEKINFSGKIKSRIIKQENIVKQIIIKCFNLFLIVIRYSGIRNTTANIIFCLYNSNIEKRIPSIKDLYLCIIPILSIIVNIHRRSVNDTDEFGTAVLK